MRRLRARKILRAGGALLLAWVCASVAAADDFESVRRAAEKNLGSEAGADYDRWLGDFFKARPEVEKELTECVAGHDERPPLRGYVAFDRDGSYRYVLRPKGPFADCVSAAFAGFSPPPPPTLPYFNPFDLRIAPTPPRE